MLRSAKPDALAVRLYVPGVTCAITYRPWLSEVAVRSAPVSVFVRVTAALGITDPLGSMTVPLIDVIWPNAVAASNTKSVSRINELRILYPLFHLIAN